MMTGLLVKCVVLIGVIHGLRTVSRRIGPRASGLILGLPSSTAILLVLCGWEKGCAGATEMAEASLLGLVAAVALPLAYAQAVRLGWRLAGALAGAIAGYFTVATGLGYLHPAGAFECLAIASGALLLASYLARRIGIPRAGRSGLPRSERWAAVVRTAIPAAYVIVVGTVASTATPSWAGLVGTFPSMSVAILIVTHLEAGAAEASQLAKTLPPANLSTVVFLAAFRFGCPALGLGWGTFCGYIAALTNLAAIELLARLLRPGGSASDRRPERPARGVRLRPNRAGLRIDFRIAPQPFGRPRPAHRRRFAPRLEALPC